MELFLRFISPLIGVILDSFGKGLNDFFASRRAEQTQRDLGRTEAERDEAIAGRDAAEDMAKAAVDAPSSVDDAIARLEEGSA